MTSSSEVSILVQFGAALVLVALCALIHAMGLAGISRLFHLEDEELAKRKFDLTAFWLIVVIALSLFVVHIAEIWLFAIFYRIVDAVPTLNDALYYSASAYTTTGSRVERLGDDWRLLGASEALGGFLLIGWSTAYLVQKLRKLNE